MKRKENRRKGKERKEKIRIWNRREEKKRKKAINVKL